MSNKDTKFIDSEEVIRTQDGKIDLCTFFLSLPLPLSHIHSQLLCFFWSKVPSFTNHERVNGIPHHDVRTSLLA